MHPSVQDKVGVDGGGAITAGKQKSQAREFIVNSILHIQSAETRHYNVQERQIDCVAMLLEKL